MGWSLVRPPRSDRAHTWNSRGARRKRPAASIICRSRGPHAGPPTALWRTLGWFVRFSFSDLYTALVDIPASWGNLVDFNYERATRGHLSLDSSHLQREDSSYSNFKAIIRSYSCWLTLFLKSSWLRSGEPPHRGSPRWAAFDWRAWASSWPISGGFNERRLILHSKIGCLIKVIALDRLPLPLSLELVVEETWVCIFRFKLFGLQVHNLSKQVNVFAALNDKPHYFLNRHKQGLFGVFVIVSRAWSAGA